MYSKVLLVFALLLVSTFSGCLDSDEETKFSWPEKAESDCDIVTSEGIICKIYLENFKTPIISLINNKTNELWIADLNGEISSWDGQELSLAGNLTSYVSQCHNEQGLLGMAFSDNFENDGKLLLSYVSSQDCDGQFASPLVLADISVDKGVLNMSTLRILVEIEQPYRNHNGGHLLSFNNNQYLWGIGDGV